MESNELIFEHFLGNDSILSSPTPTAQSISRMDPSSVSYSHPTNNFRPASISSYQKPNSQSQSHSHSGIRALPMPSQMQNRNHPISRTIKSNLPSSNRISTSNGFQKPALGLNARILDHTRLESTQGREVVARMEADVEDYFGDGDGFEEALMNDVPGQFSIPTIETQLILCRHCSSR